MSGLFWLVGTVAFFVIALVFAGRRPPEGRPPSKGLTERFGTPSPWAPVLISTLALLAGTTSAIFAGLNYFKAPKARAAIVVERFQDKPSTITVPTGSTDLHLHRLAMCISNTGQSAAKIRSVLISPEPSANFLTKEKEIERMDAALAKRSSVPIDYEVDAGQKSCMLSPAIFSEDDWQTMFGGSKKLYVFAVVVFSDELSGGSSAITKFCARVEPDLSSFSYCLSNSNGTIRP